MTSLFSCKVYTKYVEYLQKIIKISNDMSHYTLLYINYNCRIMISSSENDSGGNSWTPEIPFESLTEVHVTDPVDR